MSMQPSSATMMRKPATKEDICLVVHHQRDAHQPYPNSWLDAERLDAIETTPAIGRLCKAAKVSGRAVYVHRCAWDDNPPVICCRAVVLDAVAIDRRTWYVRFGSQQVLAEPPPKMPYLGQSFYLSVAEEP